jgi:rubrerythrin
MYVLRFILNFLDNPCPSLTNEVTWVSALSRPMYLFGLLTFSLLSSTLLSSKLSVIQNAYAKTNESESKGNPSKGDDIGMNSPDKVKEKKDGGNGNHFDDDRKLYKPTYSKIKADSREPFTVYPDKHLYQSGENVTLAGSVWVNLLSELDDQANLVSMEVKNNKRIVVASGEAEIDENGDYSTTIILPGDALPGAYTVQATILIDAELLKTQEPSVRAKLYTSVKFVVVNPVAFSARIEDKEFNVVIATNSTSLKEFAFAEEERILSFKVRGDIGTKGVVQVTLPKELLGEEVVVSIDGRAIEDTNAVIMTSDNANEMTIEINYQHSEHTIQLHGKRVVSQSPESFSTGDIALSCAVAVSVIFGIFLTLRYLGRSKQIGKGALELPSSSLGQKRMVQFCCSSCGTTHNLEACPSCGSKIKKAKF